jgi:hypothetical protein
MTASRWRRLHHHDGVTDVPDPADQYPRRRASVAAFLGARSTTLAGLYEHACGVLADRRPDGWQHLVAHVGRELMNRLADHVAEVPMDDPDAAGPRLAPLEIARRLRAALDGEDDALPAATEELIAQISRGNEENRRRAEALVAAAERGVEPDAAATEAWVRTWRELQGRFAGWAHVPGPAVPEIPAEQVELAWRELTDLLAARVAREPFFASMDDLLELARRPDPDVATARAALARLRPGTKARFYAELRDPAWVRLLTDQGMFASPPPAMREGDAIRFPEWPEGLVLLAFAAQAPDDVLRVASAVPSSDNARVAHLLAHLGAELSPESVAESGLASRIARDLSGVARLLDVADPAGRVARRLAEAGRTRKALEILRALLQFDVRTTPSGLDWLPDHRHGAFRHDDYLVDRSAREMVDALVGSDARMTIGALCRLLRAAQNALAIDDSTRWRDDVASSRSPHGDDPRHLLLELLRDACLELAQREPQERHWVLESLERQDSRVFERLRLYLLGVLPEEAERRAAVLADPDVLFGWEALAEVYALLPVAYAEVGADEQRVLLARVEAGPARERVGLPASEHEQAADEIEAWQDEWRQRLLSALEEHLDESARGRLRALRERRGTIDRPAFSGVRTTSWIGPTSPRDATQLTSMAPDELVAYLREFRAERHFAVPTPEGLGREFTRAVENDPQRWAWLGERLEELPPLYARSWILGLTAAARAGKELPEPALVLTALEWVLAQPADAEAQGEPLGEDVDHYLAQLAGADLLVALLAGNLLELADREQVWSLIQRLTADPDPTPEREARTDAEPLQLSFSALRAQGALALVRYLQWLDVRLPEDRRPGREGFAAAPETREPLEHLLSEDPSRAVRGVLAPELPVLAALDRDWLAERIQAFADPNGDTLAQAAWNTHVGYSSLYESVTSLLADAYVRAVAGIQTAVDPRQLAEHVALIWRDLPETVPTLLDKLLAAGDDDDRARVMSVLGRALHPEGLGGYEPTEIDVERHRALWEDRLADNPGPHELREFGWWWSSGRFRRPDDLRRLTRTLRIAGGRVGDIRDALQLVRQVQAENPEMIEPAVELLEVIAEARTAQAQFLDADLLADLLRAPLEREHLRDRAVMLVHAFGEQGYLMLRSLLD